MDVDDINLDDETPPPPDDDDLVSNPVSSHELISDVPDDALIEAAGISTDYMMNSNEGENNGEGDLIQMAIITPM